MSQCYFINTFESVNLTRASVDYIYTSKVLKLTLIELN